MVVTLGPYLIPQFSKNFNFNSPSASSLTFWPSRAGGNYVVDRFITCNIKLSLHGQISFILNEHDRKQHDVVVYEELVR